MEYLHGLMFDKNDKLVKHEYRRSRIKENFSMEELQDIYDICLSTRFDNNNDKVNLLHYMMTKKGFMELGSGTNRYAMMKDNYVFKFSLDKFGFDDNNTEFDMSKELLEYGATKTYECNGLISVSECVDVLSLNQFRENRDKIRQILKWMAEKYLFADLGCIDKNFRNWGYDSKYELRFLDYGYVFRRDDLLLRCTECGGRIWYDNNYSEMLCSKCGTRFDIHDIKTMMEADDEDRAELFKKKEKVTVGFAPGYDWKADMENDDVSMISVKNAKPKDEREEDDDW